jgi:lysophospholipase L1-like esterase
MFNDIIQVLGMVFLVLALLCLIVWALAKLSSVITKKKFAITDGTLLDERYSDPDSYEGSEWYSAYKAEARKAFSSFLWQPYVYWVARKCSGKYINIGKYHQRKTSSGNPVLAANPENRVAFFGGSTIWGWGARDEYTIPSCFLREKESLADSLVVENKGQLGYVSTQEMLSLILSLRKGCVPNLVIFYSGLNDVFSAYQQNVAGIAQNEINRKNSFESKETVFSLIRASYFKKFSRSNIGSDCGSSSLNKKELAKSVVDTYFKNIETVTALSKHFGFEAKFFWQPVLFYKDNKTPFEEKLFRMNRFWKEFYDEVNTYIASKAAIPENFNDMTGFFSETKAPVFIDPWHTNEKANEMIAKYIAQAVSA